MYTFCKSKTTRSKIIKFHYKYLYYVSVSNEETHCKLKNKYKNNIIFYKFYIDCDIYIYMYILIEVVPRLRDQQHQEYVLYFSAKKNLYFIFIYANVI